MKQKPLTLAMTTLGIEVSSSMARRAGRSSTSPTEPPSSKRPSSALRSTPELKARPSPVSTTTRTAGSLETVSSASPRPTSIDGVRALSASGREMVTVATAPSVAVRMFGLSVTALMIP